VFILQGKHEYVKGERRPKLNSAKKIKSQLKQALKAEHKQHF